MPIGLLASNEAEVRADVHRYAALGYEQIKVYSSMKPELVPAIIDEAHDHGIRVSGHVPAFMTAQDVVKLGFDELQHVNFLILNFMADTVKDTRATVRRSPPWPSTRPQLDLDSAKVRQFLALLKEHDTVIDPTLGIFEANCTDRPGTVARPWPRSPTDCRPTCDAASLGGGLPVPREGSAVPRLVRGDVRMVAALHRAGVRIVAGTDSTGGFSCIAELELYVRAGIPAPAVLRIATSGRRA